MKDNLWELRQELRDLYPSEYEVKNFDLLDVNQIQGLIRKRRGENLKKKLESCKPGIENWKNFQNICFDLIKLTLEDNEFEECKAIPELRGDYMLLDSKGVRKDIVIPLEPKKRESNDNIKTIWDEFRDEPWGCRYLVFDAKNYKIKIKYKQIYQMFHYLNPKNSRIGIIFSRKSGLDKSARAAITRIRDDGYMIFVLNDNDIKMWIDSYISDGHVRTFFRKVLTNYDQSFS